MSRKRLEKEWQWLDALLKRMGLTLHSEKTRIVDARREDFDFLGHRHMVRRGRLYPDIRTKAQARIRDRLREMTRRTWMSLEELISDLNSYIPSVRNYFRDVLRRRLAKLDRFVLERVARWSARKHSGSRKKRAYIPRDQPSTKSGFVRAPPVAP